MEKFHEKLKMLRKKKGLTQQEVAKLVHVERGVYTNWELGNRNPNYENLSMLACVFDVSIDYLLGDYLEISKERYLKIKESDLMKTSNVFPQRLKELRLKKGLTQTELGEKVGVKQSTFTNWENGKREPNFETIIKIADLLEVSVDWLFGRE
ncbi:helix-turn-helix domain-containing protein [Streptococcus mitis]|jgi:bacteriophage CI repressor helix-turn-helix domain|uniref:helix-turn-helix domain-containing protein n=1 Tax=Streptococcus mitis TaxID=28037 RepID=UPI0039C2FF73